MLQALAAFALVFLAGACADPYRATTLSDVTEPQTQGLLIGLPILPDPGAANIARGDRGMMFRLWLMPVHDAEGAIRWKAVADSPSWNLAGHEVEVAPPGRQELGSSDRFRIRFTLHPDQWIPADEQPIHGDLEIAVRSVRSPAMAFCGRDVAVDYRGTVGDRRVSGRAYGSRWTPNVAHDPLLIDLDLENFIRGGHSWGRRAELQLRFSDGLLTGAQVRGMVLTQDRWVDVIDPDLTLANHRLTGTLVLPVAGSDRPFRVRLDGDVVGNRARVTFELERDLVDQTVRRTGSARGYARGLTIAEQAGLAEDFVPADTDPRTRFRSSSQDPSPIPGRPDWIGDLTWHRHVDITTMPGENWNQRFEAAQDALGEEGGIVRFPAGDYELADHLKLRSGIIIMGQEPRRQNDARHADFQLETRLHFPRYQLSTEGDGTPIDTAFKGIRLADPVGGSRVGVMFLDIDHGTIHLGQSEGIVRHAREGLLGTRWVIYGNILRHAASPLAGIPTRFQHPWQRWTDRYTAAIHLRTGGHVWIANNRLPKSGTDNFNMPGYRISIEQPPTHGTIRSDATTDLDELIFDYDNRPGIIVNGEPLGRGLQLWEDWEHITDPRQPDNEKTNMPRPHGLAPGIRIEGNFIFCTGGAAITTSGDGAFIGFNIIRYKPGVVRATSDGASLSTWTNNNRGVEVRGWRWTVEGNDYEVYSNYGINGARFNDGEGIMHEAWNNVGIRGGRIINNRGNAYISIWRVPVRGLHIEGNHIRASGIPAIFILGQTNRDENFPIEQVHIINNVTEGTGIKVVGEPGPGNRIIGNRHVGPNDRARIENHGGGVVRDNIGYRH